jgi:hypothetical protein
VTQAERDARVAQRQTMRQNRAQNRSSAPVAAAPTAPAARTN